MTESVTYGKWPVRWTEPYFESAELDWDAWLDGWTALAAAPPMDQAVVSRVFVRLLDAARGVLPARLPEEVRHALATIEEKLSALTSRNAEKVRRAAVRAVWRHFVAEELALVDGLLGPCLRKGGKAHVGDFKTFARYFNRGTVTSLLGGEEWLYWTGQGVESSDIALVREWLREPGDAPRRSRWRPAEGDVQTWFLTAGVRESMLDLVLLLNGARAGSGFPTSTDRRELRGLMKRTEAHKEIVPQVLRAASCFEDAERADIAGDYEEADRLIAESRELAEDSLGLPRSAAQWWRFGCELGFPDVIIERAPVLDAWAWLRSRDAAARRRAVGRYTRG